LACRKAGIEGVTWHSLRHTFASRLVARGVDIVTVQQGIKSQALLLGIKNLARPVNPVFGSKNSCSGTVVPQTVPQILDPILICRPFLESRFMDVLPPKPNGKIERWHKSLKRSVAGQEPGAPLSLADSHRPVSCDHLQIRLPHVA
jgi:hypothetical protein